MGVKGGAWVGGRGRKIDEKEADAEENKRKKEKSSNVTISIQQIQFSCVGINWYEFKLAR